MIYFIYTIHIIVCIFLILVVLLQQGKGADLSVFGGGSTQTVFGARGAATFLHKMTVGGFIAFSLTTISIGLLSGSAQSSVFKGADAPVAVEEAAPPEDQIAPAAAAEEEAVEPSAEGDGEAPESDAGEPAAPSDPPPGDGSRD